MGGDSIKATRMLFSISRIFSVEIPLCSLLNNPTIRELGACINNQNQRDSFQEIKRCEVKSIIMHHQRKTGFIFSIKLMRVGLLIIYPCLHGWTAA